MIIPTGTICQKTLTAFFHHQLQWASGTHLLGRKYWATKQETKTLTHTMWLTIPRQEYETS